MVNIETKKVEELKELNNFKNLLLEIKEDGEVAFSIYYYPTFQIIGIITSDYSNRSIHNQRFFTKNNFDKKFIERAFNIPYYYESLEPEKAVFLRESCRIMTEYLLFLEEKKEELFKFCTVDIKKEDINDIRDELKGDFFSLTRGFMIPIVKNMKNYSDVFFRMDEYRSSIKYHIESDSFEIKIIEINKKLYVKILKNDEVWMSLGMDEISNPYKIINYTLSSPIVVALVYDIYLYYLKNPVSYNLYNNLGILLNTDELHFNKCSNTFTLSNWNRKCSIYISQYSINEELLYKMEVYTGMYAEEYSEETVYIDTMNRENAIRYLLDITECRTDNKIQDNRLILEELFDYIKSNLQAPSLLEEDNVLSELAMVHYSKYEYSEEGDKIFYSTYNFWNNDIEKTTYEFFRENVYDLVLRDEAKDIYCSTQSDITIKADSKSNDIIQLIHREVSKRINRKLEEIKEKK